MAPAQAPPDDSIAWHVYVGTITPIVPATILVILRFISRHVARAGLWWDDYTIAIALAINWAMAILRWVQIPVFGLGRHEYYLPYDKTQGFFKSSLGGQIIYFLDAVLIKAALLLLYYRIFGVVKYFRWAVWVSGFLITGYFIACTIISSVGCSPVTKLRNPIAAGSCKDVLDYFRWNGVANLLLDVLVLCLPLPLTWRLKTTIRQKIVLTGIFMLGGFACVASIMRIISFRFSKLHDVTWNSVDPTIYSSIEQSVGIICACLPTLGPLFRSVYSPSRGHSNRSPVCSSSSSPSSSQNGLSPFSEKSSSGEDICTSAVAQPSPARTPAPRASLFDMSDSDVVDSRSLSLKYGDGHEADRCLTRGESMV